MFSVSVSVSLPTNDLRYFKLVHFDNIFVVVKQCHSDIKILNHNLTWPTAHYRTSLNSAPSYFAKVSPGGRVALWPIYRVRQLKRQNYREAPSGITEAAIWREQASIKL